MSLLIVEGPDGAGKTTLVDAITKAWDERGYWQVYHHGAYPGESQIAHHYLASIERARRKPSDLVVMDRSWLAEPIYGDVMRSGEHRVARWQERMLERAAMSAGAVVVLCWPALEVCQRTWGMRLEQEYLKKAEHLALVHQGYQRLVRLRWAPVLHWDYTRMNWRDFLPNLFFQLGAQLPEPNGVSGAKASFGPTLLVGDEPARGFDRSNVPFVDLSGEGGCSAWLTQQLENWDVPESRLAWINQGGADASAIRFQRYAQVIALGSRAGVWLEDSQVEHQHVPHPQYWKRFHHHEPYALKELLT